MQVLWERKDGLSSTELFLLGEAIYNINKIDPNWVNNQLKAIKGNNKNNRNGAFFELLVINMLLENNAIPAKLNQPGIDAILNYKDNFKVGVSLKNYSLSYSHNLFIDNSDKLKNDLIGLANQMKINNFSIVINFKQYPSDKKDWEKIKQIITEYINNNGLQNIAIQIKEINCTILLSTLPNEYKHKNGNFYNRDVSYQLITFSEFHKNEEKNLVDKIIDDACHNLNKHADKNSCDFNFLFIKLPITANSISIKKYVQQYLQENKESNISGIILYQPAVINKNTISQLHHYIELFFNENKYKEINEHYPKLKIDLTCGIGVHTNNPSFNKIYDKNKNIQNLEDKYIYQRGEYHYLFLPDENNEIKDIPISKIASGIHLISYIISPSQLPNNQNILKLSGNFPPTDELLIL